MAKKIIHLKEVEDTVVDLKEIIAKKKSILENARTELKKKFFGIDEVIDKFVNSVEGWYLFPELRSKPLIVNLWGITGVGKTALVREFAKLVEKEKEYCEIATLSTDAYQLSGVLEESNILPDSHAIILIDEFQQLKTINEKSEEIETSDLIDLWSFLSDGSFPVPYNLKTRLDKLLEDANCERTNFKQNAKIEGYYVTKFYNVFKDANLGLKYDDIKNMTYKDAAEYINIAKERVETYTNKVYSKLLIIVSGNLDEAFTFSKNVSDADTDADFMNEIADEVNVTNIKAALLARFRPEQISRLGNIHIIYPVLNKEAYIKLIEKNCNDVITRFSEKTGITFTIGEDLKRAIYKNGVFPSQGARPVFSTISIFLENPLSYFVAKLIDGDKKNVTLSYNKEKSEIVCENFTYKVENDLEEIREDVSENNKVICSVHEAGHAVAQALLFGIAPKQITIKSSNSGTGGFCTVHNKMTNSKEQHLKQIQISLGGRAAEEVVFGKENITSGAGQDNYEATMQAISFNCYNGLGEKLGYWDGQSGFDMNAKRQSEAYDYIEYEYKKVLKLIKNNSDFLIEVSDELYKNGSIDAKEFCEIAKKFGIELKIKDLKDSLDDDYIGLLSKFKKRKISIFQKLKQLF